MDYDYFIFSSHKTGTQSIVNTFKKNGLNAVHLHSTRNFGLSSDSFRDILRKRQIHESRLDAWLYVCKLIEDWIDTTDDIPAESIAATIVFYELSQSPKGVSHARVEQLTSVPMNVFTIHSRIIREQIFEKIAEEE